MSLNSIKAWRNDKWYSKRVLIWHFTLVLIKINYGQIEIKQGSFIQLTQYFIPDSRFSGPNWFLLDLSVGPTCWESLQWRMGRGRVMVFNTNSTIFQLYRGGQFYWWRKPEKTTDLSQITSWQTLSHNFVSEECFSCLYQHFVIHVCTQLFRCSPLQ